MQPPVFWGLCLCYFQQVITQPILKQEKQRRRCVLLVMELQETRLILSTLHCLDSFREGNRKNPIMSPFAADLSNADMNNLAAYFASEKRTTSHVTSPQNLSLGPELANKYNCTQCHGPNLQGLQHIPRVAGQQHQYLMTQLRGFKAQTRSDMDGNMSSAAANLTDNDIVILSDYIAGLAEKPAP